MSAHPLAGQAVPESLRINVPRLVADYYTVTPDPAVPDQAVSFGTSGHRGSSFRASFNEAHILAITRAVCEFRRSKGIDGPLFVGMDSHALSEPAMRTVLEVLVITPSHNPPEDGGIKYNPPHGGPAGTDVTVWIEKRANELLASPGAIARVPLARALKLCGEHDYIEPYVRDLAQAIDMEAIARAGVRIGVDPLGGAGLPFWEPIAGLYGLDINVANAAVDPAFMFMSLDKDGKIRMDCSSSSAMAKLIALKDSFSVAFANDPDADRHGIVTARHGLMNPNHYLAVAIDYLLGHRPGWNRESRIGKTLVTSSMVDRIAAAHGREVREVPVGFKWFVDDLLSGACCFGGEESAGASFLRRDGGVWTTDKDGILLNLLAAEITAVTGKDLGDIYLELEARHGSPLYERLQAPADRKQRELLASLTPGQVPSSELAGESILAKLTHAPGNGAAIGGLKVVTENGWFAARPSGTEDMYKIYVESFRGREHLDRIKAEAQAMVDGVLSEA